MPSFVFNPTNELFVKKNSAEKSILSKVSIYENMEK